MALAEQQSVFSISTRNRFAVHTLTVLFAVTLLCLKFLVPNTADYEFVLQVVRSLSLGLFTVVCLVLLNRRNRSRAIETSWTVFSDCSALFLTALGLIIALAAISILVWGVASVSEDVVQGVLGSVVPAFVVSFFLHALHWLDRLVALYKSSMVVFFRKSLYAVLGFSAAVTLVAPWLPSYVVVVQEYSSYLIAALFFLTIIRLPWIQTLSRMQKWKALGISIVVSILASILIGTLFGETSQWSFVRDWLGALSNGLPMLTASLLSLVMLYFVRVMISIAVSLPTAGYVDKKMREVDSLAQLSSSITQTRDLDDLLKLVTEKVREVCGATGVWIEYRSGEHPLLTRMNIGEAFIREFEQTDAYAKVMEGQNNGIYIENAVQSPLLKRTPSIAERARSIAGIPLTLQGEHSGMIFALHRSAYAFDPTDIELLRAFADNAVIAIENARMLEAARDKERYRNELLLARQMQQKLLPRETPKLEGVKIHAFSEPAYEVGGDYYDFLELQNGNTCIVVGDVSGKGISAAFIMAEIKGVMSALAGSCSSVSELLVKANEVLIGSLAPQEYVTVLAAEIDASTNSVHVCRAGHTPMILRTAEGATVLQPNGMGVGLVGGALFANALEQKTLQLSQHDACILFTDGVNESVNEEFEEFGYDALLEIVAANECEDACALTGRIVRSVAEHAQAHEQHDDLTLVVLTIEESKEVMVER